MEKNLNLTLDQTAKLVSDYDDFIRQMETLKEIEEPKSSEAEETTDGKILNLNNFVKALIKAIGLEKTKEVRYIVQGVNVFFEFKGNMYKCYTPQSKLYKLSGQRFNLITWRDLKKEASEADDNSGDVYTVRPPPESSLLNMSRK